MIVLNLRSFGNCFCAFGRLVPASTDLRIVYRRPRRADFTVRITQGRACWQIIQVYYDEAAPCVPDQWTEGREQIHMLRFWVDGDEAIGVMLDSLRARQAAGDLTYAVNFGFAPDSPARREFI